jgi:anaerobic magnesium-protoporphyrin IX monomethyl ester cyclase
MVPTVRVVFLEVDTERGWAVASIGPAFIGAYLREHGHEVVLLRAGVDMTDDDVVARVAELEPCVLGLSLTTRQWLRARDLVRAIRERIDVPVVAGGLHPTFSPEEVLDSPGFDHVCLGEGEEAMLELVEAVAAGTPADDIANLWTRGAERPSLRPPYEPIDELPFMARDLLDEPLGTVHMATQRGCPFPCTYCAARIYSCTWPPSAAARSLAPTARPGSTPSSTRGSPTTGGGGRTTTCSRSSCSCARPAGLAT